MIDFLTLQKLRISIPDAEDIAAHNFLQENSRGGLVCYDNKETKNLEQNKGVCIIIEPSRKLKVECSLHKYWNATEKGVRENYDLFSMPEAIRAIDRLLIDKKLPRDMRVYNFEIGLNLHVQKDPIAYLDKVIGIGDEVLKKIYVNPAYDDERSRSTEFSSSKKKHYKLYDKGFEMLKKKQVPPDGNVLRIETVRRRVEGYTIETFFTQKNMYRLMTEFFKEWEKIRFYRDLSVPPRTGRAKKDVCRQIIESSAEEVLAVSRDRQKNGALTAKEFRNIREFIRDEWPELKKKIRFVKSPEEEEFRTLLNSYKSVLMY